jgi:hypothetical protein
MLEKGYEPIVFDIRDFPRNLVFADGEVKHVVDDAHV